MAMFVFHHRARPDRHNPNFTLVCASNWAHALDKFNEDCEAQGIRAPLIFNSYIEVNHDDPRPKNS